MQRGATHQDDLKEHLLVNLHELLIPLLDIGGTLARVGLILVRGGGVGLVMLAPLDDLLEDSLVDLSRISKLWHSQEGALTTHVGNGDGFVDLSDILKHVLDQDRALGNLLVCLAQE